MLSASYLTPRRSANHGRGHRDCPRFRRSHSRAFRRSVTDKGPIFPTVDLRPFLQTAAEAVGIPAEKAKYVSAYDFRHGRATELDRHLPELADSRLVKTMERVPR